MLNQKGPIITSPKIHVRAWSAIQLRLRKIKVIHRIEH
jgi:hypothetical protein